MNKIYQHSETVDIADGESIERTPYPGEVFDFIIMSHVLEHVESDLKAIRECERILQPGGFLIVLCPAHKSMICTEKEIRENGHIRLYTRERVQWLESENFPCVHFRYVHWVHNLIWNRLKFVLKALNYPFKMLDKTSLYDRRLYRWIAPKIGNILDHFDTSRKPGNAFFVFKRLK